MSSVYVIVGKDAFLQREFIRDLKKKLFTAGDPGGDFQEFDAAEESLGAVLDFLSTAPFLNERRLAILWHADSLDAGDRERLVAAVGTLPPASALAVVSDESTVKKSGFLQALAQKGRTVPCNPPFESGLVKWLENRAGKSGKRIERPAAELVMERAGRDVAALDAAVEQLAVFTGSRPMIALADAEALLGRSVQTDAFRLSDYVLQGDAPRALASLERLLKDGARGAEIVAALASQWDRLARAQALFGKGLSAAEIGASLNVHSFYLEKFVGQAKKIPKERLSGMLSRLLDCDQSVKTGKVREDLALEWLMVDLCTSSVGGGGV